MNSNAILKSLLDKLWQSYIGRVEYAAKYAEMVKEKGSEVHNDHIALRTFNCRSGSIPAGVAALSRIFEPLGYQQKEKYEFPNKKLIAWHWEHKTGPDMPKIFISQLEIDQLPEETANLIKNETVHGADPLTSIDIELLNALGEGEDLDKESAHTLVESLVDTFARHWPAPHLDAVEKINEASQYAAWTLLHGHSVNHFTAFINKQNVKEWPDLETTHNGLAQAGIPMKSALEGEKGSKLRQSSTQAIHEQCDVILENGSPGKVEWSYAYYELAERGFVKDETGKEVMFHGFLGEQATNLFEMTKK